MSNVEFSEEEGLKTSLSRKDTSGGGGSGLHKLAIRLGLAKDETGANMILIGVAILAVVLAVTFFAIA